MSIKTGRIRRRFDEGLKNRILCENMLLMSLAYLNYRLTYDSSLKSNVVAKYQKQKTILARCAIANGISKDTIADKIQLLSSVSYPSDGQIARLTEIAESNVYSFQSGFIPDTDLKLKSDEEIADFKSKKSIKRNDLLIKDEQDFIDLCSFIESEIVSFQLTDDMRKRLQKLKKDDYDYPVILQSFKWHKSNINKSIERKVKTEQFKDIYSKFIYICAIIERKLPETLQKIETDKAKELEFWDEMAQDIINGEESIEEAISIQCDKYPDTTYYGKNDYVKEQLTLAIERVKVKEQKKREDAEPEQEHETVYNWDSNSNYQNQAEKPHKYDNLW